MSLLLAKISLIGTALGTAFGEDLAIIMATGFFLGVVIGISGALNARNNK